MGQRPTINRCLLFPFPFSESETTDKFLILGCHFSRNEVPFLFDTDKNKYISMSELSPVFDQIPAKKENDQNN